MEWHYNLSKQHFPLTPCISLPSGSNFCALFQQLEKKSVFRSWDLMFFNHRSKRRGRKKDYSIRTQAQVTTMRWLGKSPQSLSINAVEVNIHGPQHSLWASFPEQTVCLLYIYLPRHLWCPVEAKLKSIHYNCVELIVIIVMVPNFKIKYSP